MYDGIGFVSLSKSSVEDAKKNDSLKFFCQVDKNTGIEVPNTLTAKYKNLKVNIVLDKGTENEILIFNGNLCKYLTGLNNVKALTYEECVEAILLLCEEFNLDPQETRLFKLETGFNLKPPIRTRKAIDSIMFYKDRQNDKRTFKNKGHEALFEFVEYSLKIYDKGRQFKLKEDSLRIEHVATSKRYLNKRGLYTLDDLFDAEKVEAYSGVLKECIEKMVIDDRTLDLRLLKPFEQKIVNYFRDPINWKDLCEYNPDNCLKRRKQFVDIIERYSTNNLKHWLLQSVRNSVEQQLRSNKAKFLVFPM